MVTDVFPSVNHFPVSHQIIKSWCAYCFHIMLPRTDKTLVLLFIHYFQMWDQMGAKLELCFEQLNLWNQLVICCVTPLTDTPRVTCVLQSMVQPSYGLQNGAVDRITGPQWMWNASRCIHQPGQRLVTEPQLSYFQDVHFNIGTVFSCPVT